MSATYRLFEMNTVISVYMKRLFNLKKNVFSNSQVSNKFVGSVNGCVLIFPI